MDIGENIRSLQQLDAQNGNDLPSDNVNISDVLDVLHNDPLFGAGAVGSMPQTPAMPQATVVIVEQPAAKALRFRYECEGRSAGSLPGVNSTAENKTYPTVRILNYVGQVTIVVSCVTKDEPYRPHPHNLVGRERCERGVCTIKARITEDSNVYQFKNLGIQCVKRRDIADALKTRADLRVDPFRTGFEHRNNTSPGLDLNAVRLAFQVFLHDPAGGPRLLQLRPVVSDIIYDKKAMGDLQINRASHCAGPVAGGTQMILLCEKVSREDAVVLFYEKDGAGRLLWEEAANTILVHKQAAIVIETPKYNPPYYSARPHAHVTVEFCLKRLTDNERSNVLSFEYIPEFQDSNKRRKTVMTPLMNYDSERYTLQPPIKIEPNRTPPHMYSSPGQGYPEPQQQWAPLGTHFNESAAWGGQYAGAGAGAGAAHSPGQPHGSPLGALSPHNNLQSPLSPTHTHTHAHAHASPMGGAMSPLAPIMSPMAPTMVPMAPIMSPMAPTMVPMTSIMSPMGPTMAAGLLPPHAPPQQPPPYQGLPAQEQMDTTSGAPSLSALLNAEDAALHHDLYSLSSLVGDRAENLSDSLRQLSTNDLFRQ